MDIASLILVLLLVLAPSAVLLLWLLNLRYRRGTVAAERSHWLIQAIASIVVIVAVAVLAVASLLTVGPGVVIIAAIILMMFTRYFSLERRSLLAVLATAASKGIPLEQAARSFADERVGSLGARAARGLAQYLEAGVPLPEALRLAGIRLPTDALVAVRVGSQTGSLPEALDQIARGSSDLDTALRSILEKCVYLCAVACMLLGILVFLMLKIVPVFAKMFQEFELELPAMTQLLVYVSSLAVRYWFIPFPFWLLLMFVLGIGLLYYVGLLPRDVPGVNRLALRSDGALVMRALAWGVRRGVPLGTVLGLLAQVYPRSGIRTRLQAAGYRLQSGAHWCDSLRTENLIRPVDQAVLKSAERAGNLAWALQEMADSTLRRLILRLRFALAVGFPALLLLFGGVVAFFVISLFIPLIALIQGLS